jgi:hypothetical protein
MGEKSSLLTGINPLGKSVIELGNLPRVYQVGLITNCDTRIYW